MMSIDSYYYAFLTPHLVIALDGIDECLICHDLRLSIQEGLEAILYYLKLLFADLKRGEETRREEKQKDILHSQWQIKMTSKLTVSKAKVV